MITFNLNEGTLLPKSSLLQMAAVLFILALMAPQQGLLAQNNWCGQTEVMNNWFEKHPELKLEFNRYQEELKNAPINQQERFANVAPVTDTIPVVFHILHLGGSENISNAQIQDQINILNRDFQKLNADTIEIDSAFKNNIANVGFAFRLATVDPNGNCTNGITRHYTTKTNWHVNDFGEFIYSWPRDKYLNIYIVKTMDISATAYAYLPGTGVPPEADVIVSLHTMVGSIGTGTEANSRVLTHEVAHWFGVQHTWGNSNQPGVACGDDLVDDTPITKGFVSCSLNNVAICTPGVNENVQNYMDYSPCKIMFTNGQAARMINTKNSSVNNRNLVTTSENLVATGVRYPLVCTPEAEFKVIGGGNNNCSGTSIQFQDATENAAVTSWQWQFPGGIPQNSNDSMPTVQYNVPGLYSVTYTATNSAGSSTITKTDWIRVGDNTANIQLPLSENFETLTFPANEWRVENESGGPAWELATNITGASGTRALWLNNLLNDSSRVDVFYTPSVNIAAILANNPDARFTFKLAHQRATTNSNERLQVYYSTNCGQTWVLRYSKAASGLATVTGATTDPYSPVGINDWRTETVSLASVSNQPNVLFKFVYTSDAQGNDNNIYIDDLNISSSTVGIVNQEREEVTYTLYPNPANNYLTVESSLPGGTIEIYDALGKKVMDEQLTNETTTLLISNLCKGIYVCKLKGAGTVSNKRITIQ